MAQQKSEDRGKPQGRRKPVVTREIEFRAGGEAIPVDLEKSFDRVNHQRLMSKLAQRVADKAVLVLIGHMLKAMAVLPDGLVEPSEEGVPQGGPLSPLLSNIVLDELDRELERRGHCFVRYADDCNIYVRSERAGQRVMASVTQFIEKRLLLKVNAKKSAVARPEERHFVGFRVWREPLEERVEVMLSKRSTERRREAPRTDTAQLRKLARCVHPTVERLPGRLDRLLRALHRRAEHLSRPGRAHSATAARAPASPLETQTHDRAQPHPVRHPSQGGVEQRVLGTQVHVGTQPHEHDRSSTAEIPTGMHAGSFRSSNAGWRCAS